MYDKTRFLLYLQQKKSVAKHKLQLYSESTEFDTIIQPTLEEQLGKFPFQGTWNTEIFHNNNPIVLELGCGKAEYSLMLAQQHPEKNFIGVDIKGDRILRGAREAKEKNISNIRFLRMQIEQIHNAFSENEIKEIWITFPDPQPHKKRKRLTSEQFLNKYKKILIKEGFINLKTDSTLFYESTLETIKEMNLQLLYSSSDIYNDGTTGDVVNAKTYYERKWLKEGLDIKYVKFKLHQ